MFDKGDLVRWYPDYDNDIDYELEYFDSYAREDPRSCYIYEVNNTLTGWYTDIDRIKESNQADYDLFLMNIYSNRDEENPLKKS